MVIELESPVIPLSVKLVAVPGMIRTALLEAGGLNAVNAEPVRETTSSFGRPVAQAKRVAGISRLIATVEFASDTVTLRAISTMVMIYLLPRCARLSFELLLLGCQLGKVSNQHKNPGNLVLQGVDLCLARVLPTRRDTLQPLLR